MAILTDLGKSLSQLDWKVFSKEIQAQNPWFTPDNVQLALDGIQRYLGANNLRRWVRNYRFDTVPGRRVGIIMAGNIPLVGFHDLLSVLITGNQAILKLSSQDQILMPLILRELERLSPTLSSQIELSGTRLPKNIQLLIATGGTNTARYFRYHYRHIPAIIRSNRTSHAVLHGHETRDSLKKLGRDLFSYFGRGCRNVSKIWVPDFYDFTPLAEAWKTYRKLLKNQPYLNNCCYQRALLKTDQKPYIDFDFTLLCRHQATVSPIGIVYFDHYLDELDLERQLDSRQSSLQCIASENGWFPGSLDMGTLQAPDLWDYADNLDTVAFLLTPG